MERLFHPLWSLQSCWLETACNAPQCFQRHAAPPGTKELSQQPSADFGSRVLQMQKRRFLVLIFTGCLRCTLNEFVDLLFTETWPVLKSPPLKKEKGVKTKTKKTCECCAQGKQKLMALNDVIIVTLFFSK